MLPGSCCTGTTSEGHSARRPLRAGEDLDDHPTGQPVPGPQRDVWHPHLLRGCVPESPPGAGWHSPRAASCRRAPSQGHSSAGPGCYKGQMGVAARDRGHMTRAPTPPPAHQSAPDAQSTEPITSADREPEQRRLACWPSRARRDTDVPLHYLLALGTEGRGSWGGFRPVGWGGGGGAGRGSPHLGPLSSRLCMWMCHADLLRGLWRGAEKRHGGQQRHCLGRARGMEERRALLACVQRH